MRHPGLALSIVVAGCATQPRRGRRALRARRRVGTLAHRRDVGSVAAQVYVAFLRWPNCAGTPYLKKAVEVFDGTPCIHLWTTGRPQTAQANMCTKVSFDLTPYENAQPELRFGFGAARRASSAYAAAASMIS